MKYIVTGGSGFIGTNLVSELLAKKKDVLVLDKVAPHYDAPFMNCNLSNLREIRKIVSSLDKKEEYTIFHLAGLFEKDFNKRKLLKREDYLVNNFLATKNLVSSLVESQLDIDQFLFSSPALLNSFAKFKQGFENAYYVESKHLAEQALNPLVSICDSVNIARISRVIGKRHFHEIPFDVVSYFIKKLMLTKDLSIPGANLMRDYVYVSDAVTSILNVEKEQGIHVNNIFSEKQIDISAVANIVNETLEDHELIMKQRLLKFQDSVDKKLSLLDGGTNAKNLKFRISEKVIHKTADEYVGLISES